MQPMQRLSCSPFTWCKAQTGLWLGVELDLDIWGRNCDRSIERSPAFESLDELAALLVGYTLEGKVQLYRVEECHVRSNRLVGIEHPANGGSHRLEWYLLCPGQHLHELDPAGSNPGEKEFAWGDGLARTAVLGGSIHHEMLGTRTAEHPSEGVCGTCLDFILPYCLLCHRVLPFCDLSASSIVAQRDSQHRSRLRPVNSC